MGMGHEKEKNISGSRDPAVRMLLPLKKDAELRSRFARDWSRSDEFSFNVQSVRSP